MHSDPESPESQPFRTASLLLEVGNNDPLYRDLYLRRAMEYIAPLLPAKEYARLKMDRERIDELVRRSKGAVERGDWEAAREMAAGIKALRETVDEHLPLIELGTLLYDPADVRIDPLSPGLVQQPGEGRRSPAALRESLSKGLVELQRLDPQWKSFYASRRSRFAEHADNGAEEPTAPSFPEAVDQEQLRSEALKAVEQGDVERLERLRKRLQEATSPSLPAAPGISPRDSGGSRLDLPFPAESAERGKKLGLVPARLEPLPLICDYIEQAARKPEEIRFTPDGGLQMGNVPGLAGLSPDASHQVQEALDLFITHPFTTSAGGRYLPRCQAETLLVEDFPESEGEQPHTPLLERLELPRRRALARVAIERALLLRGPDIVEELGLDPREFRLVLIPPDAYSRLGRSMGWGEQRIWTHFDGYQLLSGGAIRALVGGDVRYGGLLDLCSISKSDEREGVTARFAVVRRSRLAP